MVFVGSAGVARELRVAVVRALRVAVVRELRVAVAHVLRVCLALLGFMRAIKLLNSLTKCVHF